ncbi:MAG: DUF420 domain-containing protein [Candidatus Hydrogenedentota bacterium]
MMRVIALIFTATIFAIPGAWAQADFGANIELPTVPEFSFTDQDGEPFTRADITGKVTVIYFFFTSCTGPCPVMNANMAKVTQRFEGRENLAVLAISVDPETDTPDRLKEYAQQHDADTSLWHFLTGDLAEVNRLASTLMVQAGEEPIFHSTRFILADRDGRVRDYFLGTDRANVAGLQSAIAELLERDLPATEPATLPTVNALLNGIAICFLIAGWLAIKRMHSARLHKRMMIGALAASAAFLVCYVIYHAQAGSVPYHGEGLLRIVYFAILIPHVILAALMVPFIAAAVYYALRGRFDRHTAITRWLWPVWMFVSVTGVVIYFMLYHL